MNKVLILAIACFVCVASSALVKIPPEANYHFSELAGSLSYPLETHQVVTDDGYILTYFRIQAKNSQIRNGLPVVLLNHGLLDSSDSFIVNNEEQAAGFILANRGFDVWLSNNRGNRHALGHTNPAYDSSDADSIFWDFSWQEMSQYDLPAGLRYIAQHTGRKVNYAGHSEGCTIMFAALARRDPVVIEHLDKFIALAPAVFLQHSTSLIVQVGGWIKAGTILKAFDSLLHRKKFGYKSDLARKLGESLCVVALPICIERVKLLSDADTSVDNVHRFPITVGHFPAGTSVQNVYYWSQMFNQKEFEMYDYGKAGNQAKYGQPTPPIYDLGKITEPIYMFVGEYDHLASVADTATLRGRLTGSSRVEYRRYPLGHGSFIWGLDVATYVNDVIDVLNS
jgi:pimeloyl-ACP methyl ester carboxylesterase